MSGRSGHDVGSAARRLRGRRPVEVVVSALALTVLLSGCTVSPPPGPSTAPADSDAAAPQASPSTAPDPVLIPGGTADENRPYFEHVVSEVLSADPMPGGRAIVDGLVAAGFDRTSMEVTPDATTIGREVDSVQFSVRLGEECLLGQAAASGHSVATGPLADGTHCLVGNTRPIDW